MEVQSDGVGGTHRDALITKCGNAPPTIQLPQQKKSDSQSSNFLCKLLFCSFFLAGKTIHSFKPFIHASAPGALHLFKKKCLKSLPFFLASVKSNPTDR